MKNTKFVIVGEVEGVNQIVETEGKVSLFASKEIASVTADELHQLDGNPYTVLTVEVA